MSFNPFHFGIGVALKAIVPRQFSLSVFCFAQVATDSEVLVQMARRSDQLHVFFHTYVGAAVIGLISVAVGRPLCQRLLRWWASEPHVPLKEYFDPSPEIRIGPAIAGAFIGTVSHVFLDSLMHADVRPLSPFSDRNEMFGVLGPGVLHLICFMLAVIGIFVCARIPNSKL